MDTIIKYFVRDPLRILYLLGGAGGLWFWISLWRDRIRIKVRIVKDGPYITNELEEHSYFQCEIENIGGRVTSLEPFVLLTGYSPTGTFEKFEGKIAEAERDLSPHKAKLLTVEFPAGNSYVFLLFRTYRFRLTRGMTKSLRVWSASKRTIGRFRFYYERILFRCFGKYNEPNIKKSPKGR